MSIWPGVSTVILVAGRKESFAKTITEGDVSTFAGLVGDFNPAHMDAEYARQSRLGRRTAHAMLAGGMIFSLLHNRLPGPGAVCLSHSMEFLAPIFIGDTLRAEVEVAGWQPEKRLLTMRTYCFNQADVQVVTGQAILMIDG
jgi:3-hydroxybutyryl-CoA dehydratase